mmetsp:Transcript_33661/g.49648  ORF Transcript_33661/g.49648 Transcript_33661/m.49648 type:complete len:88 (-) Transcript_33661:51-314(-)|eukprot:scaffold37030_cov183-Skeletonema_dohrnii-CCMP3373.AAC.2
MYLVVKKASAVSTMLLPAPAVMKAVPVLMNLLRHRQAEAGEDRASCQLYHDAAEEEVGVSGGDEVPTVAMKAVVTILVLWLPGARKD